MPPVLVAARASGNRGDRDGRVRGHDRAHVRRTRRRGGRRCPSAPEGAPNVVIVLLDDVGYAQFGCYGSDIATPTFDRLAADGRRYANFHTTALCSPTRACLLTGRNHHSNGMARVVELAAGFPGYNSHDPEGERLPLRDPARRRATPPSPSASGTCRRPPRWRRAAAATRWPLGRGFERYYGFMGGETDQYRPELVQRQPPDRPARARRRRATTSPRTWPTTPSATSRTCGRRRRTSRSSSGSRPAPATRRTRRRRRTSSRYRGQFDHGLGRVARARSSSASSRRACCKPGTELSERPRWVPAWDSLHRRRAPPLRADDGGLRRLPHPHRRAGRPRARLHRGARRDSTTRSSIVMSDNGASAEGGAEGLVQRAVLLQLRAREPRGEPRAASTTSARPRANNHYPWGWAWAGNTPLKRFKRDTHEGGVADPLHRPLAGPPRHRGRDPPPVRARHRRACRRCSTLIGIDAPAVIDGVEQTPIEGVSFAAVARPTAGGADAPRHAVLRDARLTGALPRRLEGGRVPPAAVPRLRRQRRADALRRRHLGAVPRRRGLLRGARPRRRASPTS